MNSHKTMYRLAMGLAIVSAFLLVWLSLGVGIIGKDGDPANRMYFGVVVVGIIGASLARLNPPGMSRTLIAMALAQALIALISGMGQQWSGPLELSLLNGIFIALFVSSAWLFRRAATARRQQSTVSSG